MPDEFMTPARFASKVEWEGGVDGALEYGLKHTHLDPDDPGSAVLRAEWLALEALYEPFEEQARYVADLLEEIPEAGNEEDGD